MNYYPFHVGDYRSDTSHLSLLEHGIYRQLIDWYYLDEHCIPAETQLVFRRLQARTDEEKFAVQTVLDEFFQLTPEGYSHSRCDAEIVKYQSKAEVARSNGKSGGRPKKTESVISGLPRETGSKANQEPRTTNQEPLTKNQEPETKEERNAKRVIPLLARPHDVAEQVWNDWKALRKAKRATVSETVVAEARKEAQKAGMPLERFLSIWCARGSQGLQADWIKPNEMPHAGGRINKQEALEASNREVARRWAEKQGATDEQR